MRHRLGTPQWNAASLRAYSFRLLSAWTKPSWTCAATLAGENRDAAAPVVNDAVADVDDAVDAADVSFLHR